MSTTSPAPSRRPEIVCPDSGPEPPYPLRMEGEVISGFGRGSKELGIPTANLPVDATATPWIESAKSGVYFGYASLALPPTHPDYAYHGDDDDDDDDDDENPAAAPSTTTTTTTTSEPPQQAVSSSPSPDATSRAQQAPPGQERRRRRRKWHVYPMVMSIGYNPFYRNRVRSAEVHLLRRFRADFYGAPLRLLLLGFIRDELDYAGLDALVADINTDCDVARRSLAREAWTPRGGVLTGSSSSSGSGESGGSSTTGTLDGSWLVRD